MFLARFNNFIRYTYPILHSSIPLLVLLPFSTQTTLYDYKPTQNNPNINEHHVLNQLSILLPIRHQNTQLPQLKQTPNPNQEMLLSPEDRLRGVFIQKLNGKHAIKHALTAAAADLEVNSELVAKVLNKGNLNGGAMVMLFEWAVENGKVVEDVGSYNMVLKALGRRKFFDFMKSVVSEMRSKGLNPNHETLSIFIDSLVKAKRVSKGLYMFRKLEEEFGMGYDLDALKVMLRCLCQRSQVAAASALLGKMKGKVRYDGETYNIVIRGWCKFGRVKEMERVLKDMVEDGFDPDSLTFSYLLEGLGRNGQIDGAVKMFENMKKHNMCALDADVFNAMICNFISIGDIDECLKKGFCPSRLTCARLNNKLLASNKVEMAYKLFLKVKRSRRDENARKHWRAKGWHF